MISCIGGMWVLSASQPETVLSLIVPAGGTEPSRLAVPVCLALFGTTADFFAWLDWRRKKPCACSSFTVAVVENLGVFGFSQANATVCLGFLLFSSMKTSQVKAKPLKCFTGFS